MEGTMKKPELPVRKIIVGNYEFVMENYSGRKGIGVGIPISSDEFELCGHRWVVQFFPEGKDAAAHDGGFASLEICLRSECAEAEPVQLMIELYLVNHLGKSNRSITSFLNNHVSYLCSRVISKMPFSHMWIVKLLWLCFPSCMMESFSVQMEKKESIQVFRSKNLESVAAKILRAAQKLELKAIREPCELILSEIISVESVASLLQLADDCNAAHLKSACLTFAAQNRSAIVESDAGEYLKETCPLLFLDLVGFGDTSSSSKEGILSRIVSTARESLVTRRCSWGEPHHKHKLKEFLSFEFDDHGEVEMQMENLEKLVPDWFCKKMAPSGDLMYNVRKVSDPNSVCERINAI